MDRGTPTNDTTRTRRTSRGVLVGAGIGLVAGGVLGLVLGLVFNDGFGAATWAAAMAGAIFGTLVAAFWGGMSKLDAPRHAEDPSTGPQDHDVPGG